MGVAVPAHVFGRSATSCQKHGTPHVRFARPVEVGGASRGAVAVGRVPRGRAPVEERCGGQVVATLLVADDAPVLREKVRVDGPDCLGRAYTSSVLNACASTRFLQGGFSLNGRVAFFCPHRCLVLTRVASDGPRARPCAAEEVNSAPSAARSGAHFAPSCLRADARLPPKPPPRPRRASLAVRD